MPPPMTTTSAFSRHPRSTALRSASLFGTASELGERDRLHRRAQAVVADLLPASCRAPAAISSVTVRPHSRPWHGPMPQRRKAFIWFGPSQPIATVSRTCFAVTSSQRQTMVSPDGHAELRRRADRARRGRRGRARPRARSAAERRHRGQLRSGRRRQRLHRRARRDAAALDRGRCAPAMPAPSPATAMPATENCRSASSTGDQQSCRSFQRCSTPAAIARLTLGTTPWCSSRRSAGMRLALAAGRHS